MTLSYYWSRPYPVEAIQWDGSRQTAEEIMEKWGLSFSLRDDGTLFFGTNLVKTGSYLVGERSGVHVFLPQDFERAFRPREN